MAAPAAQFPGITARPNTMAIVTPAQPQQIRGNGYMIHSVDRSESAPGGFSVDFQAGGRMYRYYTDHSAQRLQVCDGATWATISTGPQTPLAVESVLRNMAGIGITFQTFRHGYEQWYFGRVWGWTECDEQSRAGMDF